MNPNNNPNDRINLDLSLGIGSQKKDPVEELVRSVSDPPPNAQLFPPPPPEFYNNVIYHWNVSGAALFPSSPLGVALPPSPSPYLANNPKNNPNDRINLDLSLGIGYLASGQLFQPPQVTHGGAGALETPQRRTRLGRPPSGHKARRKSSRAAATVEKNVDEKYIVPPYPWATTRPARIHNLRYLLSKNVNAISGKVHCRICKNTKTLVYNLKEKFMELYQYIYDNKEQLRQRSDDVWSYPKLTPCSSCENGMKPVIGENKENINWLFLLLGQMLGCCRVDQLRYFCDKTSQHRTGAKDRVLYITYLGLCNQLEPSDLFSL